MGLGLNGGAVEDALFFIRQGAHLTITDLKTARELAPSLQKLKACKARYVLGKHRKRDFISADLIIKNPGVPDNSPYLKIASAHGIPVDTSAGIFAELSDMSKVIGVTGTKGKSSTAALIHAVLNIKFPGAYFGGNIGSSPLKFLEKNKRGEWGVLELSSWQLQGMRPHKKSPGIAIITNIVPEHLNRHGTFENYINAKKNIFRYQHETDALFLNCDEALLRKISKKAPARVIMFSAKAAPRSTHHPANVNAALAVAKFLDIDHMTAKAAINNFLGLEGRMQKIARIGSTEVYNDTTATHPYATQNSLSRLSGKKISLIVGGEDKNLDYAELARILLKIYKVVLLPGSASDKIMSRYIKLPDNFIMASSLVQAVREGMATKPDILLLSPAAASFNMFKNEFDRGKKFTRIIKKLIDEK